MDSLNYDGTTITWGHKRKYKTTSGMKGFQNPRFQCKAERGPVPEGNYHIALILGKKSENDGRGICQLKPSWIVEEIPRGEDAGGVNHIGPTGVIIE